MAQAATRAYQTIRARILGGEFPAGAHLREGHLANEIGVSRTPVREALRRLAADGFVQFVPNHGAYVIGWAGDSLTDLIDVRAELAAMGARLAASRIQKPDLDRLTDINKTMAKASMRRGTDYLNECAKLNLEFHAIVFKNSGNQVLEDFLRQTSNIPLVQRSHFEFDSDDWVRATERYTDLISALKAGDGNWASSIIKAHFLASKHAITRNGRNPG
ncbi:MAG TPA: GntR family transcriptional regulator [Pseudolabrys sp.]|nr:GntR family transcriptional regulator [Pseudolabrys sp.]